MADSIGAVIGINGEECSLGSLAGLEAQPLHKAKPRQDAAFGLDALKRRPYNGAPATAKRRSPRRSAAATETRPTVTVVSVLLAGRVIPQTDGLGG